MVALRINVFGGMIPAQDDHLLPDGGAALAQNTWLYTGTLEGFKSPRYLRNLTSSTAKRVYRIPNDAYEKTNFNNSIWMEFEDQDVEVLRAPVRDDSYQRYYWVGPSTVASYNTYARIAAGSAPYKLGIPQPGSAPTVNAAVTAPDTVAPTLASAVINGALVTLTFTEERRLDAANPPPKTAFRVSSPTRDFNIATIAVDGPNRKIGLLLDELAEANEVVTVSYTDPTAGDDQYAIQDEAGNDAASFTQVCTNETVDRSGPVFERAEANGNQVVIWFKDANALSTTNLPATSTFKVTNNGATIAVSSISVDGPNKKVTLTLASNVSKDAWVIIWYTDPTVSNDANAIQDTLGNDAIGFSNKYALNLTQDINGPNFSGATFINDTVLIVFDETLGTTVPSASLFTVVYNALVYTPVAVSVNANERSVSLRLDVTTQYGTSMTVSYNGTGTGTKITDADGNTAASFTNQPARNDNPNFDPYSAPYIP